MIPPGPADYSTVKERLSKEAGISVKSSAFISETKRWDPTKFDQNPGPSNRSNWILI